MYFFAVAFGLLLHVLFWGVGFAVLVMPRPWGRYWPILAGAAGLALQSLTVWIGAYANLPGTNSYAWWSEAIPVALLALALWRCGGARLWADLRRLSGLWLTMAVALCAMVLPLTRASRGLTTMSLGSCDAADYAAGARILMEFARGDRGGFLGLTEVVQVMSVDNFFDYWLRLNHFAPSALIALNGAVLDCLPHELTSLMTVVLLVSSLPVVFWLARAVMGYSGGLSIWLTALYGFGPITWYAVFHVAMGQLLAAHAIALITWAAIALWRSPLTWRRGAALGGVLGIAYALLLTSYNFIIVLCLVPAVTCVGGLAAWRSEWRKLGRWALLMIAPFLVCSVVFAERVAGLMERFTLLQTYDFGWRIPSLSPEGWVGIVSGTALTAFPGWQRFVLAACVVTALIAALLRGAKRDRRGAYLAVGLTLPVLLGYEYLNFRGVHRGTNASYDAYKLLAVFYPGLLVGLCYWLTLIDSRGRLSRWTGWVLLAGISGFILQAAYRFAERMETPPLIVSRELMQVGRIEAMSDVASVNIRMPDMWSRLWANALLLRKPQYFRTHTYEGRRNTALRGEWDLNGGLVQVNLPAGGSRQINPQFSLEHTSSPYFLRARIGTDDGWYDLERQPRATQRWRWTDATARISLENPHPRPLYATCRFLNVHALVERDFQVWAGGVLLRTVRINRDMTVRVPDIVLPPGHTTLEIRTTTPLTAPGGADKRLLGFRIFGVELDLHNAPEPLRD
ncbi:MAG TPA: hypothetical protein VHO24_01330 [Opitutaceae bacterium]|nr:hypothetical protein [Opitutaceae bacterium]